MESWLFFNQSTNSRNIMEARSSIPSLQQPAASTYPVISFHTTPPPFGFKIHFNTIHIPKPRTSNSSLTLRFSCQKSMHSPVTPICYMPRSFHSSWFYEPNNIWWAVQIIKLLAMQSFPVPCYLVSLRPKYPPQHPIKEYPQPMFLPECERPNFTLKTVTKKIMPCISICVFLDSQLKPIFS